MTTVHNISHHWIDGGDDPRDLACGWLIENADRSPNARLTHHNERRAEVHDPDSDTVHVFHLNDRTGDESGSVQLTVLVVLAAVLPLLASVAWFTAQMFGALEVV